MKDLGGAAGGDDDPGGDVLPSFTWKRNALDYGSAWAFSCFRHRDKFSSLCVTPSQAGFRFWRLFLSHVNIRL